MEVSGQIHVPAALPPRKEPLLTFLDAGVRRKISNTYRDSNPVAQRCATELYRLLDFHEPKL
jgi:hypothetical protein